MVTGFTALSGAMTFGGVSYNEPLSTSLAICLPLALLGSFVLVVLHSGGMTNNLVRIIRVLRMPGGNIDDRRQEPRASTSPTGTGRGLG